MHFVFTKLTPLRVLYFVFQSSTSMWFQYHIWTSNPILQNAELFPNWDELYDFVCDFFSVDKQIDEVAERFKLNPYNKQRKVFFFASQEIECFNFVLLRTGYALIPLITFLKGRKHSVHKSVISHAAWLNVYILDYSNSGFISG